MTEFLIYIAIGILFCTIVEYIGFKDTPDYQQHKAMYTFILTTHWPVFLLIIVYTLIKPIFKGLK